MFLWKTLTKVISDFLLQSFYRYSAKEITLKNTVEFGKHCLVPKHSKHKGTRIVCMILGILCTFIMVMCKRKSGSAKCQHITMTSYERRVVSNHPPFGCLFNLLSGPTSWKHQNPHDWSFVRGIQRWQVNSPHRGPVTRKRLPFHDVIIKTIGLHYSAIVSLRFISYLEEIINNWFNIYAWIANKMTSVE